MLYLILNALLCIAGLIVCVCRGLHMDADRTSLALRAAYVVEASAFVVALLSVTFAGPVTGMQVVLVAAAVLRLWLSRGAVQHITTVQKTSVSEPPTNIHFGVRFGRVR